MSGLVRLRARIEPEGLPVLRLLFAADGHPVCAREAPPWECAWDAGTDVAAHNLRAVAVLTDGTRLVDSVRTEAAGFAPVVDVDVVQVAATVNDEKGRPVKGLGREAFRVLEDGQEQEVTLFIGAEAERELVVVVDMSGSMVSAMGRCREAVKRFLATVRPVDHVTLLAFNDSVFTVSRAARRRRKRACGRWTGCAPGAAPPCTTPCCEASTSWRSTAAVAHWFSSRTARTWAATRPWTTSSAASR